jgi:hypothetical protein
MASLSPVSINCDFSLVETPAQADEVINRLDGDNFYVIGQREIALSTRDGVAGYTVDWDFVIDRKTMREVVLGWTGEVEFVLDEKTWREWGN